VIVELFKKIVKSIQAMFNENTLAAAQIAQIFGSELLKVQQNAQTDSGHRPDIVRIDPKRILMNNNQGVNQSRRPDEQRIMEALQREAEAMCPLPAEQHHAPESTPQRPPEPAPQQFAHSNRSVLESLPLTEIKNMTLDTGSAAFERAIERIASSLERIANVVDRIDIKQKTKTIKRKPKSSKPVLLNETQSQQK
jgi:hypothetical protein